MKANKLLLLSASAMFVLTSCGITVKPINPTSDSQGGETTDSSIVVTDSSSTSAEEGKHDHEANVELEIGETYTIPASTYEGAEGKIRFASSNTAVATVDEEGVITAWGPSANGVDVTVSANREVLFTVHLFVEDPKAKESSKITLSDYPTEITDGEDGALDADLYVTATAGYFYLTTTSETVRIEGHKIVGVSYGEFTVTIVSGKVRRAFQGIVISSDKYEFNQKIRALDNDFMVDSSFGTFFNTDNYYGELYDIETSGTSITSLTFRGGVKNDHYPVEDEDGETVDTTIWLPWEIVYDEDRPEGELSILPGYSRPIDLLGYEGFNVDPIEFTEELDAEGNGTGNFFLDDTGADEYGEGGLVGKLLKSLGGLDYYWSNIFFYDLGCNAIRIRIAEDEEGNEYFEFIPAIKTAKGYTLVTSFESGNSQYDSEIDVIPGAGVEPMLEEYLEDPYIIDQIDTTPISGFVDSIFGYDAEITEGMDEEEIEEAYAANRKSFTLESFGVWYDLSTGAPKSCPSGWRFSSGEAAFGAFDAYSYVNPEIFFSYVDTVTDPGYSLFSDVDFPKAGAAELYMQHDGTLVDGEGNNYTADATINYSMSPTKSPTGTVFTDFWDLVMVPWYFTSEAGWLELTSFLEAEEVEEGVTVYTFDNNGLDVLYGSTIDPYADYDFCGLLYRAMSLMPCYLGAMTGIMWGLQSGIHDITFFHFTLDENEGTLTFTLDIPYALGSGTDVAGYACGWTISGVGVDNVPANVKAYHASYFNLSSDTLALLPPSSEETDKFLR